MSNFSSTIEQLDDLAADCAEQQEDIEDQIDDLEAELDTVIDERTKALVTADKLRAFFG
jgi:hypothetical protein